MNIVKKTFVFIDDLNSSSDIPAEANKIGIK
jgi:hypothetical protein